MTLYHGGDEAVERPDLKLFRKNLDWKAGCEPRQYDKFPLQRRTPPLLRGSSFGHGFYTTMNKDQAVNFAWKMMIRKGKKNRWVSVYDFDMGAAEKLDVLQFPAPDRLWLDFVHENRFGTYAGKLYDLIIGPVANDDVFATLIVYEQGILNVEQTLETLKIKKLYSQFVFKTEKALSLLNYVQSFDPGHCYDP